jgi:hypothetical protein
VKKPLRKGTKKALKREKRIGTSLQKALNLIENKGLNEKTRPKVLEHSETALSQTRKLNEQQRKLTRLDKAVRDFDTRWLRSSTSLTLRRMTPEQQRLMREAIREERARLRVEEELEALQQQVNDQALDLQNSIERSKECLLAWNAPGAAGWLEKAIQNERKAKDLELKMLAWIEKLIKLVKHQERKLAEAEH